MGNYKIIIVEGLIGSGKSQLSQELAAALGPNTLLLDEPDERHGGNPYLADYYGDPGRYAFVMQMHLLALRYRMHELAQWHVENNVGNAVMDRSYFCDTCFARLQVAHGYMSEKEFYTYHLNVSNMAAKVKLPHMCLRLLVDPETSNERIKKRYEEREGRKCESAIDIGYLTDLDDEYELVMTELGAAGVKILDVPWDVEREDPQKRSHAVRSLVTQIERYKAPDPFLSTLVRFSHQPRTPEVERT